MATWIEIKAAEEEEPKKGRVGSPCAGFVTLLQPRNASAPVASVLRMEELPGGAATAEIGVGSHTTLYLLGARKGEEALSGTAAVVGVERGIPNVAHLELVQGTLLALPRQGVRLSTSAVTTLSLQAIAADQLRLTHDSTTPVTVELQLPWASPEPRAINVWRGAHVWHVANGTAAGGVAFEILPGESYLIERQCQWSTAPGVGYGQGGWLCDPEHDDL